MKKPFHLILRKTSSFAWASSLAIAILLAGQSARAVSTFYWDENGATAGFGTAGTVGTNWSSTTSLFSLDSSGTVAPTGSAASTSADIVNLGTTSNGLGAGTITLSGTVAASTINFGSGDAGTVVLSGGVITLSGTINDNSTTLQTINSNLDLGGGARTLITAATGSLTLGGVISNGSLTVGGNSTTGIITLTGSNTFAGGVSIVQGRVNVSSIGDNGTTGLLGSGTVTLGGSGNTGGLRYTGAGETANRTFILSSGNAASVGRIENNGTGLLTLTGSITNSSQNHNFEIRGTGTGVISGAITDGATSLSLVKNDAGTWTLSGTANTYDGATTITAGVLAGSGSNAFGSTTGISIAAAGTLSLRGDTSTSFVKASDSSAYSITTTAGGATINVDQATGAGTGAKTMTIGNIGTSSTSIGYSINFTGANNTGLTVGAVTGATSVATGTMTFSNSNSTGTTTIGSYTSANTTGGETVAFTGNGNTTVSGAITPSATALALSKSGSGTLTLSGSSSYTGNTTFNNASGGAGTILLTNGNALGSGTVGIGNTNNGNDARLMLSNNISLANNLNLGGQAVSGTTARIENLSGTNTISGNVTYALTGGGFANIVSTAGKLTLSGSLSATTVTASRVFDFGGAGDTVVSGNISNGSATIGVQKDGAGKLTLSGSNTNTGTSAVNAGTLQFAKTSSLYNSGTASWTASNIVVANGATFALNVGGSGEFTSANVDTIKALGTAAGGFTNGSNLGLDTTNAGGSFTYGSAIANTNSGSNAIGLTKLGSGTLALTAASTYTGTTAISAGTLQLGNGSTTGSLATGSVITNAGSLVVNRSNAVVQGTDFTSTAITGTGSFTQAGSGTTTLGNNSYSGATTVSAGTLIINGTNTSSNVTVQSGAKLGGNATIGSLTVTGGTVSPGNSPGIVNTNGNFSLDSASTLAMELTGSTASPVAGTNYDQVNVVGTVTLGSSNLQLSLNSYTHVFNGLFFLVANDSTDAVSGVFASLNGVTTDLSQGAILSVSGSQFKIGYTGDVAGNTFLGGNDVVLQAIPEPATWALVGVGLTALTIFRRRRTKN